MDNYRLSIILNEINKKDYCNITSVNKNWKKVLCSTPKYKHELSEHLTIFVMNIYMLYGFPKLEYWS